jgi:MFS family permease
MTDMTRVPSTRTLTLAIFAQMLPATLIAPAVRPLVAAQHAGQEGVMHAFMALNMIGAIVAAPVLGTMFDRIERPRRLLAVLAVLDALLLASLAAPLPTAVMLGLRVLEGAAHVGGATILLAEAAGLARLQSSGRTMGAAGAAIMFAVAAGHGLGGALLKVALVAPFVASALVALGVALWAARSNGLAGRQIVSHDTLADWLRLVREQRSILVPVSAAFLGRFTVGCVVVTFALFARNAHGVSDSAIGGLFALLTFVFAIGMVPAGRACDRVAPSSLLVLGAGLYALTLAAVVHAPSWLLAPLMAAAGACSALIFAPTLCFASRLTGEETRGRSMSLVNAAGCAGMLIGPLTAGLVSSAMDVAGDPLARYRAVFYVASLSVLVWLAGFGAWLALRGRRELQPAAA